MPTNRRQGQIARAVFEVLMDNPEGLHKSEVLKLVEERLRPTRHEQSILPNRPRVRRYDEAVNYVLIGPVKAGWFIKDNGRWSLTEKGRAAYRDYPDPEAFQHEWNRLYQISRKKQP